MSNDESNEDRQRNELEVLESIYVENLTDLRGKKSAWNKWQPLNISISLTPLDGSSASQEINAKVDLHINCTQNYPTEAPKILLENSIGMSNDTLTNLKKELEIKAKELIGEVMIFELAEYIKAFLYRHNKPATKSFYEEMVLRQKEIKIKEQEAIQLKLDRETQDFMSEIQQREDILKLEIIRRREQNRLNSEHSNDNEEINRRRSVSCSRLYSNDFDEELLCDHNKTKIIEFNNNGDKKIIRGSCICHKGNCIKFNGMDQDSGQLYIISEWAISINNDPIIVQRQIASVEQELNYLVKLKHQNLSHYLNMKYDMLPEQNKLVVYVLQEFVFGSNCAGLYLYGNISVDIDMLRHIAEGVLNALDFLHRNNVVHKDLSESAVYINKKGVIKVCNYSLNKRLSDLEKQKHSNNYNKKTDIHNFGFLILSLIKGAIINEKNCEIPQHISPDLYDFINKCLFKEEKDRHTAMQLLNHSFLKSPLVRFSPQRNVDEKVPDRDNSPEIQSVDFKLSNTNGLSRVENEFELLDHLGKGAYGDVFKVQNKLDQGYYALKRIELNPKNKLLNKKIIREVKLLSRLNHENVVRYYNSWMESAVISNVDDTDTPVSTVSTVPSTPVRIIRKEVIFLSDDNLIEQLAPPIKDVEWSISYGNKSKTTENESSNGSSDESSDEDDDWGMMRNIDSSSDSDNIEFARSESDLSELICEVEESKDVVDCCVGPMQIQFMYIQMEFCEKSTLRTAIDSELYLDNDRVWRLFREITEGLAHIHQQGMIHRDLKPMNIFLDSNDHVKIGDFGLATTNLLAKPNGTLINNKSYYEQDSSEGGGGGDPSMTGHIGTALYVAPELTSTAKAVYNQKVDIYSLGIILFEMSYKPMTTGMERISILTSLRSKDIIIASDFLEKGTINQEYIIKWLLNHDASNRPTSHELLQSDYLPPPVLEEFELRELVRHTLSNPQLKAYKYLVESCFKQPITAAQDITYDRDMSITNISKQLQIYDYVKDIIKKVFQLHCGQDLSTPLLMPKSKYYDKFDSCVKLMTHSGNIVSIPHDLRVPFARYVAWNGITFLRRYSIERVYREKRVFGFVPRELYECAFDIVTPTAGNFMADAELLYILNQVVDEIPGLKNNLCVRLNHTLLLKAILIHCGIKDMHNDLCNILSDARDGKVTKLQFRTHLISQGLSDNSIVTLFNLLESESSFTKMVVTLQPITKKKSTEASQCAKQALQELKCIIQNAEALGVTLNIVISPGLVYNIQQYSGMMCQLVCEIKKKHKHGMDVLAAGGRYDNMITSYRNIMERANMLSKDIKQSAVGISISLDKLVQIMQKQDDFEGIYIDVVICSLGSKSLLKEKTKILHDLWSAGIKSCLIEATTLEDIQEQCTTLNVPHVVILKDTEHGVVRIRSWERDRFQEKKIATSELIEYMQRVIKSWQDGLSEQTLTSNSVALRSDSKVYNEASHEANVNVYFLTVEKLSATTRKRYENLIRNQMDGVFDRLNGEVCLLALSLEIDVIKTMASHLDFESERHFNQSVEHVKEKHQRHKKYLNIICEEIYEQKSKRTNPIIILYSLNDNLYKTLL